ncbi:endonuclease/exonuclease/phosphatase family protein [Paractinoplanes globisporus]|uniref:Endonuclease/exonuclease/phosphatase family protein n=1 Tax=Paractinoplanes globisporus TaxID=113565 RepID=A0ABW6WWY8_9ACTN|nr:endonuclease/exonuclease/phosphatase family protein [Actinoplanes globisporus]
MRLRLVLALVTAVLTVLVGAPAQATRPPAMKALTFNLCGNVCRNGEVADTAGNIAYKIRKLGASVVMLQELCYSQFLGIRDRLARYGYAAEFAAASHGGHCNDDDHKHGTAFGVALIARGQLSGKIVYRLPSPYRAPSSSEGRVVLGAVVRLPGRTLFAVTTHTALGPNLSIQLAAIRRWLVPVAARRPVLFGGDLNLAPSSGDLDPFYTAFDEADADRDHPLPTFIPRPARKIDYLFGSKRFLTPSGVARADTGYSDHSMYLGAFR